MSTSGSFTLRSGKSHPLLIRLGIWVVLPLLLVQLAGYLYLRRSLPLEEGSLRLPGLTATVKVLNDANGVPHIFARTDHDAFRALGYVHARDRLWQMESQRRLGEGRLSELLGRSLLRTDKYMRTLGLYRVAKRNYENLEPRARASLEAYAQGVNAWLSEARVLPIEFQLLGLRPEPWRPEDSLLQVKLLSLSLDRNYRDDLAFSLFTSILGAHRAEQIRTGTVRDLETASSADSQKVLDGISGLLAANRRIDAMFGFVAQGAGSNAWVVAGQHTASGKPLLANDPHLKTQIPALFYLAELEGGELHVAGATIPGLPLVLSGHNQQVSWGITALYADVQDVFLERKHISDDNLYEADGKWLPMQVEEQLIKVRADFPWFLNKPLAPLRWPVRSTRHGPVISDALGTDAGMLLSLKWAALKEDDASYAAFLGLNYARDWQSFRHALRSYTSPALNIVYADALGNIAQVAAAEVPIRKAGDGSLPVAGWDSAFEWQGVIPREQLPSAFNPPHGYLVTANNRIHGNDYPYSITRDWAPGYRAQRIADLITHKLQAGKKLAASDFIEMQGDQLDLQAQQMLPLLQAVVGATEREQQALQYLRSWDLRTDKESIASSLYYAWLENFNRSILTEAMRTDALYGARSARRDALAEEVYPLLLEQIGRGAMPQWCDLPGTQMIESCTDRARSALTLALRDLEFAGGRGMRDWQWGELHQTHYPHSVFADVRLLDKIFDRSTGHGGNAYTVDAAPTVFSKDKGYRQVAGAGYRQVIDLSDWNRSGFINNTGQSGNVFSRHYDDNVVRHRELQLLPMSFGERAVRGTTLLLQPANAGLQQ